MQDCLHWLPESSEATHTHTHRVGHTSQRQQGKPQTSSCRATALHAATHKPLLPRLLGSPREPTPHVCVLCGTRTLPCTNAHTCCRLLVPSSRAHGVVVCVLGASTHVQHQQQQHPHMPTVNHASSLSQQHNTRKSVTQSHPTHTLCVYTHSCRLAQHHTMTPTHMLSSSSSVVSHNRKITNKVNS
jgi:hypothetical protein